MQDIWLWSMHSRILDRLSFLSLIAIPVLSEAEKDVPKSGFWVRGFQKRVAGDRRGRKWR